MASEKIKIGMVQMACTGNKSENLEKAIAGIKETALQGANIVCLQELFSSLYFCNKEDSGNFDWAEEIPGPTLSALQALASEYKVVIIASLFEKRTAGLYHNTTAVLDADGSVSGIYRKHHIPDDPGFYEKYYFTPGDTGYKVFNTKYAKIGVLICWDQWFPEAARITALKGAEIIFYPTAIGWDTEEKSETINTEQFEAWQTIQRSHAIANGIHIVAVNRVGTEAGTRFWGGSFVSNPFGTLLYNASQNKEENAVIEVDLGKTEYYRTTWPFLRDRRIDSYKPILKILDK